MERGLLVELSPKEETTLWSIFVDPKNRSRLAERHLVRLAALALIERSGKEFKVTTLGSRRLAFPEPLHPFSVPVAIVPSTSLPDTNEVGDLPIRPAIPNA